MKQHLNTLYVTTQGAYLAKEGETIAVKIDGATCLQLPVHTLGGVVCFGRVGCSPYLMGFCAERDVAISFLTETGRFLASVKGASSGNVLLRRRQYRLADDPIYTARLARAVLVGKLNNSRTVLQRALRDHGEKINKAPVVAAATHISALLKEMRGDAPLDRLRGLEGDAARSYFGVFNHLILSTEPSLRFSGRNRRPPLDAVNALLSFLYTLLVHDVRSALEAVGLDPYVGFLHKDRPGRPSLALDLMEELRPFLADRMALSLINLGQAKAKQFQQSSTGAVLMNDDLRKKLLTAYQKRKLDEIHHPFLEEKVKIGLLFHVQALLLARHLRGDLDAYPPFCWR